MLPLPYNLRQSILYLVSQCSQLKQQQNNTIMKDYLNIRQITMRKVPREVLVLQDELKQHILPLSSHFPCANIYLILEQWEALNDLNVLVCFKSEKQVTKPSDKFTWVTDSSLLELVNKMFKIGLDLILL